MRARKKKIKELLEQNKEIQLKDFNQEYSQIY